MIDFIAFNLDTKGMDLENSTFLNQTIYLYTYYPVKIYPSLPLEGFLYLPLINFVCVHKNIPSVSNDQNYPYI